MMTLIVISSWTATMNHHNFQQSSESVFIWNSDSECRMSDMVWMWKKRFMTVNFKLIEWITYLVSSVFTIFGLDSTLLRGTETETERSLWTKETEWMNEITAAITQPLWLLLLVVVFLVAMMIRLIVFLLGVSFRIVLLFFCLSCFMDFHGEDVGFQGWFVSDLRWFVFFFSLFI